MMFTYLTHTAETLSVSLLIPCSVLRVVTLLGDKYVRVKRQHQPLGAFSKSFSCLVPHCDQTYHKSNVLSPNGPVYIWRFL